MQRERGFIDLGGNMVRCIHCSGAGTDPMDDREKPCYLCDGLKAIARGVAEETCRVAELLGSGMAITI
jgi:hypothetical protein